MTRKERKYECEVKDCPNEGVAWHKLGFICCSEHLDYNYDHILDQRKTIRNND